MALAHLQRLGHRPIAVITADSNNLTPDFLARAGVVVPNPLVISGLQDAPEFKGAVFDHPMAKDLHGPAEPAPAPIAAAKPQTPAKVAAAPKGRMRAKSSPVRRPESLRISARSSTLRSSRTLPGQS